MAVFDDEPGAPPARKAEHVMGEDLSRLSVDELQARVALLKEEIARIEAAATAKAAQRDAADLFFKR
ncbi:DUF1192 domain-containing protein [Chenggangzhangella methanolivorans]|uniref:DUF1192 domain-containing protein n=1 Tax=Chenggangzhangella methanolivorans TaxID=1437009 RepID=A0A9E6UQS5_9HYPH|nr:DUF1192 domain-containing protein [Chenggangzhangella methanolivorans]QZO01400.1 DUF1192 domain-containing protein [Chenggangzhangella methanolivorans]